MKRKKHILAAILVLCLGMGMMRDIVWENNAIVKAASDVIYTEGQPVDMLVLDLLGIKIEFTEENTDIDITSCIPDNLEWKYYHHMDVNYEIKYAEDSSVEADNGDVDHMEGKIHFVHRNLYNIYPEYLYTKYKCTVQSFCNGEMTFVLMDKSHDYSDFENSDDKMYIFSLKPVNADKTWAKKVEKVTVNSIYIYPFGNENYQKPVSTVPPTMPPTASPTEVPTEKPTATPTMTPTMTPTASPTKVPPEEPTATPTTCPTTLPTAAPTEVPTEKPTAAPTVSPSAPPTEVPTEEPTVSPTTLPTASPPEEPTATPTVSPTTSPVSSPEVSPMETVQQFGVNVYKKKSVKLRWRLASHVDGYEIYRSAKKNRGFQKIATVSKQKSYYIDKKIKRLEVNYYRIRPYCIQNGKRTYGKYSSIKSAMVKQKEPSYLLTRKITSQGISYIHLVMKKWSDSCLAIWVKSRKKGYVRIPLSQPNIKKNKGIYNFKYSKGKGKLYFKICTYKKGKKGITYSYSKIKGI